MTHVLRHARANAVAYLALFVALGGTSYAAASLPAGSVGTAQLKDHSITPAKLKQRAIGGYVMAWAHVSATGRVLSGSPGVRAKASPAALTTGTLITVRGQKIPRSCVPIATAQVTNADAGEQVAAYVDTFGAAHVSTYSAQGQYASLPFYVAIVC